MNCDWRSLMQLVTIRLARRGLPRRSEPGVISVSTTVLVSLLIAVMPTRAETESPEEIKYPSPDGRFALRVGNADHKVELIEKASGKVIIDLGDPWGGQVLVWSSDSKWVAYGKRGDKIGEVSVYFWNGSAFGEVQLPEDLPFPEIKFRKNVGSIRHYGAWLTPLRWLKPGELELSNEVLVLDRDSGADYTGVLHFTLAFDAQHHASVKKVGKTKTEVSH